MILGVLSFVSSAVSAKVLRLDSNTVCVSQTSGSSGGLD